MLQAGSLRIRFPTMSLGVSTDLIPPAALGLEADSRIGVSLDVSQPYESSRPVAVIALHFLELCL
jgi:hypothetical protein